MNEYTPYLLTILLGYLLGCIHPAYFIGKLTKKIDIREHGSNNSGASNVTVVLGFKYGVITAVIDIFKGYLAALIASNFISSSPRFLYIVGTAVILGHIFPFYMKFKGGKGLATLIGICFAVDKLLCLGVVCVLVSVTFITDYIVFGTVSVVISFTLYTLVTYGFKSIEFILAMLIAVVIFTKHKDNYIRIHNKTETKLSSLFKKKPKKDDERKDENNNE